MIYVISDPSRPWTILFQTTRLEALSETLAAQPAGQEMEIYATRDGHPRKLDQNERLTVLQRLIELRPDNAAAAAELVVTRREIAETRQGDSRR